MANYTFSGMQQVVLNQHVASFFDRRASMMELNFPLTQMQIVEGCTPARFRHTLRELQSAGVESIQMTRTFYTTLNLGYPVLLRVGLPANAYWVSYAQMDYGLAKQAVQTQHNTSSKIDFDMTTLDEATTEKLRKWVTQAAREKRFAQLAKRVAKEFFNYAPTLYHVGARWPEMKIIVANLGGSWPNRVSELPGPYRLLRWGWPDEETSPSEAWRLRNQPAITMIGEVLLSAEMLPETISRPGNEPQAYVQGWKLKDGWVFL